MLPPVMELLGGVGMAAALWYGSREIAARPADRRAISRRSLAALFLMYGPLKKLSRVNANIQQAHRGVASASSRCSTRTPRSRRRRARRRCRRSRQSIEFRDVSFGYDDARGTSASAARVVHGRRRARWWRSSGRSGAGKTTLVNLLPRFYDVTRGAILIDGIDIRASALRSLREQIGIVTQETVLFDDTIADNIAYGSPGATPAAIEAAARAAHAHEFIVALPQRLRDA